MSGQGDEERSGAKKSKGSGSSAKKSKESGSGAKKSKESLDPVPPETQLVQRTYDKQHRSVVRIVARCGKKNTLGTGFVVHHDGTTCLVLTCHHTFKAFSQGNMQVWVNFHGMEDDVSAEVFHTEPTRDLVLLRVLKLPYYPPVEFCDEVNVSGRHVVMMGFFGLDDESMLVEPGASVGRIMSEPIIKRAEPFFECISCTYTGEAGTSGGPVFMEDKVVGINIEANVGKMTAISVTTVKLVLKGWISGNKGQDKSIPEMLQLIAHEA